MKSRTYHFPMISLTMLVLFLTGCTSEYDQLVKRELKSGVIQDSLIFGMRMGQTKKDFFTVCWKMNEDKTITQGSGNQYARHIEPLDTNEVNLNRLQYDFYGIFDENEIMKGMDMIYSFTSWAPWNEDKQSSDLAEFLQGKFFEEYGGNEFIKVDLRKIKFPVGVKVDGNRQILVYPLNDKDVAVRIEDLNFKLETS